MPASCCLLEELTAAPTCWQTDVLASTTRAVQELRRLGVRDAQHHVHPQVATETELLAFRDWFQRHVGQSELAVEAQHVGAQGLGLVARKAICKGDNFLSVPYNMVLGTHASLGPADTEAWGFAARDPLLAQFPSCRLAMKLLAEACSTSTSGVATSESFFGPYIAVLPASFELPLFYDAEDFALLEDTPLFLPAVKLLYNAIKQFCYLRALLPRWPACPIPSERFTVSNYFWALGAVLTRQNEVAVVADDAQAAIALIPGWDLCNHEQSDVIATFSDPLTKLVDCRAIRDFKPDEQVTMFYGPRSNDQLLLYSGFVLADNVYDRVQLRVQLSSTDPLLKIRRMLIAKEGGALQVAQLENGSQQLCYEVAATGAVATAAMVRALQVAVMTKAHLSDALRNASVVGSDQVYVWDAEEKQSALGTHRFCCQQVHDELTQITRRKADSKHGALLSQYFEEQLRVLDRAAKCTAPFGS